MNNRTLVTSIVAEVERSGLTSSLRDQIAANRFTLMQSADVPTALLEALLAHSGDEWPAAAGVLELLIDDARMDAENEGAYGTGFLGWAAKSSARSASNLQSRLELDRHKVL